MRRFAGTGGGHGLLSRALRPSLLAARTLSLHNLLDHGVCADMDADEGGDEEVAGSAGPQAHPSRESMLSGTSSSRPSSHVSHYKFSCTAVLDFYHI